MNVRVLYALVATDSDYAVDLFATRAAADRALARVVSDEPSFAAIMAVVALGELPAFEMGAN